MKHRLEKLNGSFPLTFYLTLFTFGVMLLSGALTYGIWYLGTEIGLWTEGTFGLRALLWAVLLCCCIFSNVLVLLFSNWAVFSSIRELNEASRKVAAGDFSPRLKLPREREMRALVENFNHMAEMLGKQEMLSVDFVSNVSHEFKNPLSAIRGYAQLLESGGLTEAERLEYSGIISQKALELSRLVSSILELSRLDNQGAGTRKTEFSLDEQLRKTILLSENIWSEKNIELNLELTPLMFYGNAELTGEIWQNILDNALKFTPPGGKIAVILQSDGNTAAVDVIDSGIGMSEEVRQSVFNRFYQADAHSGAGNGLGLSIVYKIVTLMRGDVCVKSIEGMGTSVKVTLPLEKPAGQPPQK